MREGRANMIDAHENVVMKYITFAHTTHTNNLKKVDAKNFSMKGKE